MPRMHGEHKKDFAARQLAASMPAPQSTTETVFVPALCTCDFRPYPHDPREFSQWNRSKHNGPGWTEKER